MYIVDDVHYFSSITDFIETVKPAPRIRGRSSSSESSDSGWSGTSSLNEAWELIEMGDPKNMEAVAKMQEQLTMGVRKNEFTNSVVGHQANVPLYLKGVPTNMIHKKVVIKQDKIINIITSMDVAAMVSKEKILEMTLKVFKKIVEFENDGYRVNLYCTVGSMNGSGSKHCYGYIKLKNDREPLNIKKMMFPLTHPSMLRRLEFKFEESFGAIDMTNDGYGTGGALTTERIKKSFSVLCRGEFLHASFGNFKDDWYKTKHTTVR